MKIASSRFEFSPNARVVRPEPGVNQSSTSTGTRRNRKEVFLRPRDPFLLANSILASIGGNVAGKIPVEPHWPEVRPSRTERHNPGAWKWFLPGTRLPLVAILGRKKPWGHSGPTTLARRFSVGLGKGTLGPSATKDDFWPHREKKPECIRNALLAGFFSIPRNEASAGPVSDIIRPPEMPFPGRHRKWMGQPPPFKPARKAGRWHPKLSETAAGLLFSWNFDGPRVARSRKA